MGLNNPNLQYFYIYLAGKGLKKTNAWILLLFSSVKTDVTYAAGVFLISPSLPLRAHAEQRPAADPSDVPLGRMCRTTAYLEALFFPTGG